MDVHKNIALGWIPYFNLHPLKVELQKLLGPDYHFRFGHPTQINRWLADGEIISAASSSVCLLTNPQLSISAPVGVIAASAIDSVYLGFSRSHDKFYDYLQNRNSEIKRLFTLARANFPLDIRKQAAMIWKESQNWTGQFRFKLPPLRLSPSSATSTALVDVFYHLWFGEKSIDLLSQRSDVFDKDQQPVDLVIGDEALQKKSTYPLVLDLGKLWNDLSELPFIFAVWQSQVPLSETLKSHLFKAASLAQIKMKIEPSAYFPEILPRDLLGKPIDLSAYWKKINYLLGQEELNGLLMFLNLVSWAKQKNSHMPMHINAKLFCWQEQDLGELSFLKPASDGHLGA